MEQSLNSSPEQPRVPPVSIWAMLSLLCSLVVFCPVLTLLGPLLGVKALMDIRSRPWLRGRGIALAGIIIGLIATAMSGGAGYWWHVNVRTPILHGPAEELRAGYAGDYDRFRAGFIGAGAEASDDAVEAFFRELDRRYGRLISITQDRTVEDEDDAEGLNPYVPYVFHFEREIASAEAELVLFAEGLSPRWKSIMISDPAWGELIYPPGAERVWPRSPDRQDLEAEDNGD